MGVKRWVSWIGFNSATFLVLGILLLLSTTAIIGISYSNYLNSNLEPGSLTVPEPIDTNQPETTKTSTNTTVSSSSSGGGSNGGGGGGGGGGGNDGGSNGEPPQSPGLLISFNNPTPGDGASFGDLNLNISTNTSDDDARYSFIDFNHDLLLWMRAENSNINDESVYKNNASFYGSPQIVTGKFGNAVQFASGLDSIKVNNSAALNVTKEFSASLWFKGTDARYGQFLAGKWDGATAGEISWFMDIASGGICDGLDFYVSKDGSSLVANRVYTRSCNQTYQDGQWHHLVGVFNAGQEISIYLDGVLLNTTASGTVANVTAVYTNNQSLFIGSNTNQFYNGSIDEFLMFNRSLRSAEVKALYDSSTYAYNRIYSLAPGVRQLTIEAHAINVKAEKNSVQRNISLTSVCSLQDLMSVNSNLSLSYKQWCNIDLSSFSNWQALGVNGSNVTNFTGIYDGNGYSIANLKQVNASLGGLFGSTFGGTLRNITLVNMDIIVNRSDSYSSAGGLVALSYKSTILNCFTNGSIKGVSYLGLGGLVGYSESTLVQDSSSSATVGSNQFNTFFGLGGGRGVGGTMGTSVNDTILNVHASGYITDVTAGGLIGYLVDGIVDNSSASGNVSGCAGLVCHMESENKDALINNSYATGNVDGLGSTLGGLVGYMNSAISGVKITLISNSYAVGNVTPYTSGGVYIGGSAVGGLVGGSTYRGFFENTSAYGTVKGSIAGGLVGSLVTSPNQADLGFSIKKSSAHGTVICNGSQFPNNGAGSASNGVGGLVGSISSGTNGATIGSVIQSSYATGNVIAVRCASTVAGGLVGGVGAGLSNSGLALISNSYAIGSVSSNATANVNGTGGLIGRVTNVSILNSYSTGAVSSSSGAIVGGLVGVSNYSSTSSSYWDTQTSGQATSAGGAGKTTSQMQQQSTFIGWDFSNVWEMLPANYPSLRWQTGNCPGSCSPENSEQKPLFSTTVIGVLIIHIIAILVCAILFFFLHHKEHEAHELSSKDVEDN
jgi:hypothetical protein